MTPHEPTHSQPTEPRKLFWRLLLTASSIAALVSLLTTGMGLDRYVSMPLAWSLAAAVQMGLFGLAWLIGSGRDVRRVWICTLYLVTMLFSVTFSYVTLQSEFTEEIRPAEARRTLFDASRVHLASATEQAERGVQHSADLKLRLTSWLDMERQNGWATRTCEEEEHCYLQDVCDRIGRRIERWEKESGRTYREGPGEQLIFGTLNTELQSLERVEQRLLAFRDSLQTSDVLATDLTNQERLRRLDQAMNTAPADAMEAVTCQAFTPPVPPSYSDHARDAGGRDEQPVYAFQDLMRLLSGNRPMGLEDYPTVFALALALFIDLFVLVVALGASTLTDSSPYAGLLNLQDPPASLESALQHDIERWIDAALLEDRHDAVRRQAFIASLVRAITFSASGTARLIPNDPAQRRFGHLLVQSRAAHLEGFVKYNRVGRLFTLEDWVYPALSQHLGILLPHPSQSNGPEESQASRLEPATGLP